MHYLGLGSVEARRLRPDVPAGGPARAPQGEEKLYYDMIYYDTLSRYYTITIYYYYTIISYYKLLYYTILYKHTTNNNNHNSNETTHTCEPAEASASLQYNITTRYYNDVILHYALPQVTILHFTITIRSLLLQRDGLKVVASHRDSI